MIAKTEFKNAEIVGKIADCSDDGLYSFITLINVSAKITSPYTNRQTIEKIDLCEVIDTDGHYCGGLKDKKIKLSGLLMRKTFLLKAAKPSKTINSWYLVTNSNETRILL